MHAIIKGELTTADYSTLADLIADPLVNPYFIWGNDAEGYGISEHETALAQEFLDDGYLSFDATHGLSECVLFFPENSKEEGELLQEINAHNERYFSIINTNNN
jgi:hypothetical protein